MAESSLSKSTCVTQSVNFHQDAMDGGKLDADEAAMLETALEAMPMDLASRTKLLGYYFSNDPDTGEAINKRRTHVLWVIWNYPDSELAGLPYCGIHKEIDPDGYAEAKKLWLERIESHPKNPKLLGHAAAFFLNTDRETRRCRSGRRLSFKSRDDSGIAAAQFLWPQHVTSQGASAD